MYRSTRLIALTGLLITLIAGACFARPSWPSDLGVDFWSVPDLQARLEHENQWREELETMDDVVLQRIALKERVVAAVLDRRMSLLEAAAEFKVLNEDQPRYAEVLRETYPSRSDEECLCRNVISYVGMANRLPPERLKSEVARLEAELQAAKDADGLLCLPE